MTHAQSVRVLGALLVLTAAHPLGAQDAPYDAIRFAQNVMVPMRDGVRLDTDFTAKLVDVYPPGEDFPAGFDLNLTDGIVRARYRDTPERAERMTPGQVYELVVEPFPTANVFKKGHRIRIDISSSNFPRFDLNPNTGEPLGTSRRMVPADNSIHGDGRHASYVVLPIAPSGR